MASRVVMLAIVSLEDFWTHHILGIPYLLQLARGSDDRLEISGRPRPQSGPNGWGVRGVVGLAMSSSSSRGNAKRAGHMLGVKVAFH